VSTYRPLPTIANIDKLLPITKTTTTESQPEYTIKYSKKPERTEPPVYTKVPEYSHPLVYTEIPYFPREPVLNLTLFIEKPTESPRPFIIQTTKNIPSTTKVYRPTTRPTTVTRRTTTKYNVTPSTNPITRKYVPYYFSTKKKNIPTVASVPRESTRPTSLTTKSKIYTTRPVFNFQTKKSNYSSYTPFTTAKSSTPDAISKPHNTIRVQMLPAGIAAINKPTFNTLPDKPSPYFTRFSMKVSNPPVFKETRTTQKIAEATSTPRNTLKTSFKTSVLTNFPVKYSTQLKNPLGKVTSSSIGHVISLAPVSQSAVNSVFHGEKAKYTAFDPFGVFRYY